MFSAAAAPAQSTSRLGSKSAAAESIDYACIANDLRRARTVDRNIHQGHEDIDHESSCGTGGCILVGLALAGDACEDVELGGLVHGEIESCCGEASGPDKSGGAIG